VKDNKATQVLTRARLLLKQGLAVALQKLDPKKRADEGDFPDANRSPMRPLFRRWWR
jgi:hypothetical protein